MFVYSPALQRRYGAKDAADAVDVPEHEVEGYVNAGVGRRKTAKRKKSKKETATVGDG